MSGSHPPENNPAGHPAELPHRRDDADELTDTGFNRAYSAPESEQYTIAPYLPADLELYDYDSYESAGDTGGELPPPRWPWVVGVTAIIAAIALVASVSLLVTRTDTDNLATPATTTTIAPPVQDQITTTAPPPPPPPPPTTQEPPPPPPPETVTVTPEPPPPPPPPPPAPTEAPPPETTAPPTTPTTTTPAGPRQVTYTVTGTKAPGDIITVTYVDASGRRRTQRNVYIPWSLTVTPISQSDVGSVQASSLFLVSRLNCSITTSDGTVLSSNQNNAAQTSC
ncbi:MAG TPA: MmpS family transport accessory protein [Mycobacterium sp.]|nr:MmpS family transport accessory protein [Mycobacterium sp.]HQE14289.1 MmpS family transport accessory protein [Mycobacterium sp.]